MTEIRAGTGLQSFKINGAVEVTYNPTDMFFLERIYAVFESLDKKQDEYKSVRENTKDAKELFDYLRGQDTEMRGMIDDLMGEGVSKAVFGGVSVFAMDGDGLPLWASLLFGVLDTMVDSADSQQAKTSARMDKYLKKYHR